MLHAVVHVHVRDLTGTVYLRTEDWLRFVQPRLVLLQLILPFAGVAAVFYVTGERFGELVDLLVSP